MNKTTITRRRSTRWALNASLAAATMVLIPASPAAAHHGWDGFNTDHLVYVSGFVSSNGSWGEPHSYFDVALDGELPADTPELTIPEDLQAPEDSSRVNAALAYRGAQEELEVIIAPPAWSGRWGLDRPLAVDERFQAVGYINRTDDELFRPVVFWYGDDEVPVNQVLGNTLPVHAPLPSEGTFQPGPATTATAQDPLETSTSAVAEDSSGNGNRGAGGVWTIFGVVGVIVVVGGLFYVRRRLRES